MKEGKVEHYYVHWRDAMKLLEGEKKKGKPIEFILIDKDKKRVISSQDCFRLLDLSAHTIQKLVTEYECEEV
tara:strand:+ start:992 stop:1207 length:216 start_codon:yes stop_codon:yes gene_type:complete